MRKFFLALGVFFLVSFASLQAGTRGQVIAVIDGDTVMISSNATVITVRLIGIDAPELFDAHGTIRSEGRIAQEVLQRAIQGRDIHLELDPLVPRLDSYQRTLAYIYRATDGAFLNRQLVCDGYAEVFRSQPFRYREEFLRCESSAKANRRGLWNTSSAVREWEGRFSGVKYLGEANPGPQRHNPSPGTKRKTPTRRRRAP